VVPFNEINSLECDRAIITTFVKKDSVYQKLLDHKVPSENIHTIYHIELNSEKNEKDVEG
jgi:hypothetical protein